MSKKIFIVEDDEDISELMQIIIQNEGYSVKVFSKLDKVEKEIIKQKPNAVIMDLTIGSTDASVYARKFKKNKLISNIPIVLVSARNSLEEISSQAQADAWLPKPFNIKDLTDLIKKLA